MGYFIRLLNYFKSYWLLIGLTLVLLSISTWLGLYEAIFVKDIVDILSSRGDFDRIPTLCSLIIFFIGITDLLLYFLSYIQAYIQQKIMLQIRRDLFISIEAKSFDFFDKNQTGQPLSRVTQDVETVSPNSMSEIFNIISIRSIVVKRTWS